MTYRPDHWLNLDTWITSDQHWSHNNIRRYQGRPDNHFELMYNRWNSAVGHSDWLLHLGDLVCFGDIDRHPWWLDGLHGRKKLIKGNHDKHSAKWYRAAGFEVIGYGDKPVKTIDVPGVGLVTFSHVPLTRSVHDGMGWDVNVHGHIHGNELWYPLEDKVYVNACVEVTDYQPVRLRDLLIPLPSVTLGNDEAS